MSSGRVNGGMMTVMMKFGVVEVGHVANLSFLKIYAIEPSIFEWPLQGLRLIIEEPSSCHAIQLRIFCSKPFLHYHLFGICCHTPVW